MKTKASNKKLVLSKSTIADLSKGDMKEAYGGMISTLACRTLKPSVCICL